MKLKFKLEFSMLKKLSVILGIVLAIFAIAGVGASVDRRYAKCLHVSSIEMRLEQKILDDRIHYIQEMIWKIEDRYNENFSKAPVDVKDYYRRLKRDLTEVQRKFNNFK